MFKFFKLALEEKELLHVVSYFSDVSQGFYLYSLYIRLLKLDCSISPLSV